MEQHEDKHEDSGKASIRENLRWDFARLVESCREYLHPKDAEDILSVVSGENFDIENAKAMMRSLPESLRKAKELYEKFHEKLSGKDLIHDTLKQKYRFDQMTFQEKIDAMKKLQEETEMAEIVLSKLEKYKSTGLISEAQIDYKLKQFLERPLERKKIVFKNLPNVLRLEEREKELRRFRAFSKKNQEEYGEKFKNANLEQRKKMNDQIEQAAEKLKTAYRAKIESLQKCNPQANFLSLFSVTPFSKESSVGLYMRWFSELSVKEMQTFLTHSDLDNPERKNLRNKAARILDNLPEKERDGFRKEFNEGDFAKRKSLIEKYAGKITDESKTKEAKQKEQSESESESEKDPTALLKKKLQQKINIEEKIETFGIMHEFAKRRRRGELRWNVRSTEALREKSGETCKIIKLKRERLENTRGTRASLKKYLKPAMEKPDVMETNVSFLNQAGREVNSEEFLRTEVAGIEKDIKEEVANQFSISKEEAEKIDIEEIAKKKIKKAA